MTPDDRTRIFLRLAPLVYGRYWKTNICQHLKMSRRALANWCKGKPSADISTVLLLRVYAHHGYFYDVDKNKMKTSNG